MFCSKCGNQIPDGGRFCQHCGSLVNTAGNVPSVPQAANRPTAPLPTELPVECPICGMLAYPGRSNCLICDADLSAATPLERGAAQKSQQASVSEQTSKQE